MADVRVSCAEIVIRELLVAEQELAINAYNMCGIIPAVIVFAGLLLIIHQSGV